MGKLDGRVALVTGGGSGIGRAVVRRFLAEGAAVGVLERDAARGAELARELAAERLVVTIGDVRQLADNQRALAATRDRFGRLDIFVGNAGIYDNRARLLDIPPEKLDQAFDELFAVDVKGYVLGARVAAEELRRSRGCILFTASVSGLAAGYGGALYVAAKHAVVGLTRQLAYELAPEIRVNAVAPGYAPTELQGLESLAQRRTASRPPASAFPLQTIATPEDYAAYYVLLASDEGRASATGSVLVVDGGSSIFGPAFKGTA